jgi:hypothetical protein
MIHYTNATFRAVRKVKTWSQRTPTYSSRRKILQSWTTKTSRSDYSDLSISEFELCFKGVTPLLPFLTIH